jgi:protein SCO1/2
MLNFIVLLTFAFVGSLNAAEPTPEMLKDISIEPRLGESLDLNLEFKNELGETVKLDKYFADEKPVLLVMSYYECPMLCGLVLNAVRESVAELDWVPGKQYRIVTISIDSNETPSLAAAKKKSIIAALPEDGKRQAFADNWHFLTGAASSSRAVADSIGFRYKWVEEEKQFAHGAAIFLLSPKGKLTRTLFGVLYSARDLKLGLLEASAGKVGTIAEKFLLFCYHYDPKDNQYALFATRLMRLAAALTVAAFLGGYLFLYARKRQKRGIV